jgi:hypothetical protein
MQLVHQTPRAAYDAVMCLLSPLSKTLMHLGRLMPQLYGGDEPCGCNFLEVCSEQLKVLLELLAREDEFFLTHVFDTSQGPSLTAAPSNRSVLVVTFITAFLCAAAPNPDTRSGHP